MADRARKVNLRHRDRLFQVPIFLGKLLRGFIYMSDWKMLPMSAVIAALVCMVVRRSFFLTMEGTLKGSFAFCCVAIWNGCFNSIQVICRERPIIKREHRSGMHISSYILSHMIYQALLCAGQTAVTIYVSSMCGVQFPAEGFITGFFKLDIGITLFLIAYASDMLSLLISAVAHSTTAAMTVMPFILIFQLVFSGGFWALPGWADGITAFTISNYGLKCINAQANYNELPMSTAWNTLVRMENSSIEGSFTIGQLMDMASDKDGILKDVRSCVINIETNAGSIPDGALAQEPQTTDIPADDSLEAATGETGKITVGEVIDLITGSEIARNYRDTVIPYSFRIGDIIDALGRERIRTGIETRTAASMASPDYDRTESNIKTYWAILASFALLYAFIAMIVLEFIDKDKR